MEPEQILSGDGFVRLLGVAVGRDEVLRQLDPHVLGVRAKSTELLCVELGFDNVLVVNLELQPLLAELKISSPPKLSGLTISPWFPS